MKDTELGKKKTYEVWVDNVKLLACILVVLGHFFQSITKAHILTENDSYKWFNQTIYYFHVPLFFICSGYLYQKLCEVQSFKTWSRNIIKKIITLGIPYFTFSMIVWLLKKIFSSSVNDEIGGLVDTLFFHPASPYWYLFALFLIFLVTPTFRNLRVTVFVLVISLLLKIGILIIGSHWSQLPFVITKVCDNEIWFVIGILLSIIDYYEIVRKNRNRSIKLSLGLGLLFVILSIFVYADGISFIGMNFILGLVACFSVILLISGVYVEKIQTRPMRFITQYTMPIFLMHTLFAAPCRCFLIKIGVTNTIIHIIVGIVISFIGPIFAAIIMKKNKYLEFFLYPNRLLQIK